MAHMIRFQTRKIISIKSQLDSLSFGQHKIESLLYGLLSTQQMNNAMSHFHTRAQSGVSQAKYAHIDLDNSETFIGPPNKPSINTMTGMVAQIMQESMAGGDEIINMAHDNIWNSGHLAGFFKINDLKLCIVAFCNLCFIFLFILFAKIILCVYLDLTNTWL